MFPHASDGLVTDALMPGVAFFVPRREIGHYTSEYVPEKKSAHDSVKSRNELWCKCIANVLFMLLEFEVSGLIRKFR